MIHGASLYLPGNYINTPLAELTENPYALRSTFGGAICFAVGIRGRRRSMPTCNNCLGVHGTRSPSIRTKTWTPNSTRQLAKRTVDRFKEIRPLGLGDFYPLLPYSTNRNEWAAYQFHRDDLGRGMVLCFRRDGAYAAVDISLRGLDPDKTYRVTFVDSGETKIMTGKELAKPFTVTVSECPGSAMLVYEEVKAP